MTSYRPGIVFIGMETSGALRRRFQARGFETYSCDILPSEDAGEEIAFSDDGHPLGRHLVGDVFQALDHLWSNDLWPSMAIFHIPCTYLTSAAEWAFKDPDYDRYPGVGYHQKPKPETLTGEARREARAAAVEMFHRVIREKIKRKIVENPVGHLSNVRKPLQIVQPYECGDDASKKTCFWYADEDGYNARELVFPIDPAKRVRGRMVEWPRGSGQMVERWSNQTDANQNRLSPGEDRWKDRSRTFPGLADTAVAHWSKFV